MSDRDSARKAILARRARFLAAAMTSVGIGAACSEPRACLSPQIVPLDAESEKTKTNPGAVDAGTPPPVDASEPHVCLKMYIPPDGGPVPVPCLSVAMPPDGGPSPMPCLSPKPPPKDAGPMPCLAPPPTPKAG